MEIPAVAASIESAEPGQADEREPSATGTPASAQAVSGDKLAAVQNTYVETAKERKTSPDPQSQPNGHSRSTRNIVGNDGIPTARPANERPFWRKVTMASAGVLVVLAVVLVIALSGNDTLPDTPIYKKALKLSEEAVDLVRPVRYNIRGAEPSQLFDWKGRLQEATTKLAEILELRATDPQEVKRLTVLQGEVERDKKNVLDRITNIKDELWPLVKPDDQTRDMFPRVSCAVPIVQHARGRGSGFLFEHQGELWVATNRHVVEGADKNGLELAFMIGNPDSPNRISVPVSRTAALGAIYKKSDLAIIRLPDLRLFKDLISKRQVSPLKLSPRKFRSHDIPLPERKPKAFDKIWTVGHPGDHLPLTATQGGITGITDEYSYRGQNYGKVIQIDAEIAPGSSGGPVFDRQGRVVGIATLGVPTRTGKRVKYAIHVDELWKLLTDPKTRFTIEEIDRLAKVAAAYRLYQMRMEKDGWRLCGSIEVGHKSHWVDALQQWVNSRTWMFNGIARTQYAVMAVSDPNHQIQLLVSKPDTQRTAGSGKLMVKFKLDADADRMIRVDVAYPDSPKSKNDWPVHLGVFRRTSLPTTRRRN
jgi:S1-C subfamily serine protease